MKLELIVISILAMFVGAFVIVSYTGNHKWSGADDQSGNVISELTDGTYQPWFHSIWEPPSSEIESLLFALQASIGSIIIGYFLGYYRALTKMKSSEAKEDREGKSNARPSR